MTSDDTAPGGVLALHLGENVGYCFNDRPLVWVLPKHHDNGYVGAALFDALSDFWVGTGRPDRILLSDSLDDIEDSDQGLAKATLQVGLIMVIQVFSCRRSVPLELVHPGVVNEAIFQKDGMSRKALRSAVNSLAKRRGFTSLDPDAANALVLYEYATRVKTAAD